jgi:hypothetical protein
MAQETRPIHADRDRFLRQVVVHHRGGDFYPDPSVISSELHFTLGQTEAVLLQLRDRGWIAASPYGPERLRLTPRCWSLLRRLPDPVATFHEAVADERQAIAWPPAIEPAIACVTGQFPALPVVAESQLVGNTA